MTTETTQILKSLANGNQSDVDALFDRVYCELRALAASRMQMELSGHTLQPTALVNEAYMRMIDQSRVTWRDRSHFMAVAATMMRRVLIDNARKKATDRRGGGRSRIDIDAALIFGGECDPAELVALSDCLDKLTSLNARHARTVELKVFGGLTIAEIAEVEGVSLATVKNDWRVARAWLGGQFDEE